ncbi:MAG: hypothetical protein L0K86_11625, partial [Actinomycetia bacterium]|nr:hypothetical protein [Actinomycetes bacterium]
RNITPGGHALGAGQRRHIVEGQHEPLAAIVRALRRDARQELALLAAYRLADLAAVRGAGGRAGRSRRPARTRQA